MKYPRTFVLMALAVLLVGGVWSSALGQSADGPLANVSNGGSSVRFDIVAQNAGATLTITAPDGRSFSKEFRQGAAPEFNLGDRSLPDGIYNYELRLKPALTAGQKDALKAARGNDDDSEAERGARKRPAAPNLAQSGAFTVLNGQIIMGGQTEGERSAQATAPATGSKTAPASARSATGMVTSGNTFSRLRSHRASLLANYMFDFVIADDLIVQGSACVGLDCVNGEVFGFDTMRLKENNTRIQFDDTSAAGFPLNNWQIRANSSAAGGASFLGFVDQGATGNSETGTIVFEVDAGAPANAVKVDSTGRVGFRTGAPVLDLHVNTGNTPALRMEQNNSSGFTAQTWDIGANEANFFVRDVTGGSRLPFRVRPGAPTSSVDINASGNVGVGTASPTGRLHTFSSSGYSVNIDGPSNTFHEIDFMNSGASIGQIGKVASGNNILFFQGTGANDLALQSAGGNVGIGTTAPTALLSVNGDANKAAGGGSWGVFSDERLKVIKGSYNRGLSAVMGLRPLRYSYKKDNALDLKSDGEYVGFSAQELQKLVPEAVSTSKDGYLIVHNDAVLWTMLNAIKEQQKEIEQLKGQIKKLQTTSSRRRK
jgi:Chaperone of endosialidase